MLTISQVPRCPDLVTLVMTMTDRWTKPIALPLAHACRVIIITETQVYNYLIPTHTRAVVDMSTSCCMHLILILCMMGTVGGRGYNMNALFVMLVGHAT